MKEIIRTATRVYYIHSDAEGQLFRATFRPINKRTGQPWQAARYLKGHDAYVLANSNTHVVGPVVIGTPPPFEVWSREWNGLYRGFSTEALALAAIEKSVRS